MIQLQQLVREYQTDGVTTRALDGVDLSVPTGSIFGVIGTSGAGKSTLARCVNLLERPDSGRVVVDGDELMALDERRLRQVRHGIGMIFQHFNLLSSRTVFDNVALPLELGGASRSEIKERVGSLLELVGLEEKRSVYPSRLSGGQKQRVAIARALANKPRVLLCDEATSALDPQTTRSVLSLLESINKRLGLTILVITHEMEVVKSICDRVAVMEKGRVIEENNVEAFFLTPQTELAKTFVNSVLHERPVAELDCVHHKPGEHSRPVIRLTFVGSRVVEPIITQVARQFDIDFVILQGEMETVHGSTLGFLTVEVKGKSEAVENAMTFLRERVTVEVLGYVG